MNNIFSGLSDNSLEGKINPKDRKDKRHQMKRQHKELLESYRQLEERTGNLDGEDTGFTELRVMELGIQAKKANFTDVELQSFKVRFITLRHL